MRRRPTFHTNKLRRPARGLEESRMSERLPKSTLFWTLSVFKPVRPMKIGGEEHCQGQNFGEEERERQVLI
jgi:hypothetical protein